MSRTCRRKNQTHDYWWVLRDPDWRSPLGARLDPKSEAGRKALARFHGDAGWSYGSAPGGYCTQFQHSMRRQAKQELHRYVVDPAHEVIIDPNHHHQATWNWW